MPYIFENKISFQDVKKSKRYNLLIRSRNLFQVSERGFLLLLFSFVFCLFFRSWKLILLSNLQMIGQGNNLF